ncbi:MAG: hypothetical protein RJA70_4982, partial [Pseudomonadota bacterium]
MSKLRVYMVAKELGLENKSLVSLLQSLGVRDVRNHMSAVAPEQIERVKRHLSKPGDDESGSEERARPPGGGVIIRRGKKKEDEPKPEPEVKAAPPIRRVSKPAQAAPAPAQAAPAPAQAAPAQAAPALAQPAPAPAVVSSPAAPPSPVVQPEPAAPPVLREPEPQPPVREVVAESPKPAVEVPSAPAMPEPKAEVPEAQALSGETRVADVKPPAPEPEPRPVEAQPPPVEVSAPTAPVASTLPESVPASVPATRRTGETPAPRPPAPPKESPAPAAPPSVRPKTGIDVWQGRPGVPMPQPPRTGIMPRRVQYDAKAGGAGPGAPRPGGGRGPGGPPSRLGRGAPRRGIGSLSLSRRGGPPVTQERNAHKKVVKIEGMVSLQNLAAKMQIKAGELLMKLLGLGLTGVNINSTLDSDTAKIVGGEFGWSVEDVAVSEDDAIAAAQDF